VPKLSIILFITLLSLLALAAPVGRHGTNPTPRNEADPQAVLFQRFDKEIWPLLARGGDHSCVGCHDAESSSELHFYPDARSSFVMLLERNYFATNTPDSLLGRLTSTHPKRRMPKGKEAALKSLPIWAFHGAKDNTVKLEESQRMVDAFKRDGNTNVKLTVYPEAQHDSWTETYSNEKLYEWFLKHERKP